MTAWPRHPCRIKDASVEDSPERPVLTAHEVLNPAAAIDPRYQALALLAVSHAAPGELGSASAQIHRPQRVHRLGARTPTKLSGGGQVFGPPMSDAGRCARRL
jgi:hypothetical protein